MSFGNRSCNRIPLSNERIALISIAHHIQSFITQKDRPQYARMSIALRADKYACYDVAGVPLARTKGAAKLIPV
jgi:hypothetical protein